MPYLYLIVAAFMCSSSSVVGRLFSRKTEGEKGATKFYNGLQLVSIFFIWSILYAFNFSFDAKVLPYSLLFGISFIGSNVGTINALKHGPTMLTALFNSLSLILTTVWGFIFWKTEITVVIVVGLILVTMAIYLCLYTGKKEEKKFSWKWLLFVLMAFTGNAGCSIVQRTQQMQFDGQHKFMLMAFATFLAAIAGMVLYISGRKTRKEEELKKSWYFPITAGVSNVLLNLFVLLLATSALSPSLIYPVIGVGGLMIVTLVSLFIFKEKLKGQQWLGIVLGAVAIVLLSI